MNLAASVAITCVTSAAIAGAPVNDDCANFIEIVAGTTPFSNVGATNDGVGVCGNGQSDIWYVYNAAFNGSVRVRTCQEGFGTVLGAFWIIDDTCAPSSWFMGCTNQPGCEIDAALEFDVFTGKAYLLQVGGAAGAQGDGTIELIEQDACVSDLDKSCLVDTSDLLDLLGHWGTDDDDADLNGDGLVGTADLLQLLSAWGGCPAPCQPECPGPGACCEPSKGLGCEDAVCCSMVCSIEPYCCLFGWEDPICGLVAGLLCDACPSP